MFCFHMDGDGKHCGFQIYYFFQRPKIYKADLFPLELHASNFLVVVHLHLKFLEKEKK